MKKIFTFILVLFTVVSFAHNGGIALEKSSKLSTSQKTDNVIFPECWEDLTQIAFYRWTDADGNPLGWILGTNTYNDAAVAQVFENDETLYLEGAHFWIAIKGPGSGDIVFSINEFADGSVGEVISSVTMPLAEVEAYMADGLTPADFTNSMYVEFENLVEVTSDFALVINHSGVTYSAHGDGIAIVSNHLSEPCNAGQVLIQDAAGDWTVTTDVNAALRFVSAMFPVVGEPTTPGDDYMVTFRVNMGPATLDGFEPATHKVFITGDFLGWAVPGTEGSVELTLEAPTKDEVVVFYEDFDGAFPADWQNIVNAGPADFPGWEWTTEGAAYGGALNSTTAENGYLMVDSDGHGQTGFPEDVDLITPSIDLSDAVSNITFSVEHLARTFGNAEVYIYISVDDFASETLLYEWKDAEDNAANSDTNPLLSVFDITDIAAGEENVKIKFKWIGEYDYWWLVDDVKITAVLGEDPGPVDDIFFTATVEIPAGDIAYKYFSDFIDTGWDGGEWDGEPNRTATIDADVTLNDVFGLQVSVQNVLAESGLNLFPNPVRNTLYVENSAQINEVRIFDLTGRLVMSQVVNNNTASVNVSEFNRGVYIMQVISVNGVASQKFNVIK